MMAVAFVLLLFVREKPLAVTNEEGPQDDAGASTYELAGKDPSGDFAAVRAACVSDGCPLVVTGSLSGTRSCVSQ